MFKQPYRSLIIWKESHLFVLEVYKITHQFPKHELYNLVSQLRRAAVSVVANIVEGHAKSSTKDCLRFLNISNASLSECAVLLELSKDLKYISAEEYKYIEIARSKTGYLLNKFINGTKRRLS